MVFTKRQLLIILLAQLLLLQHPQQSSYLVSAAKVNSLHAFRDGESAGGDSDNGHQQHQQPISVMKRESGQQQQNESESKGGSTYKIGFGIGDVTGPAAEINMV